MVFDPVSNQDFAMHCLEGIPDTDEVSLKHGAVPVERRA
jgi:hypothetical protein